MYEPQIGDLILCHSKKGLFAKLIRLGQWLRPSWREYRYWNHAALVVATPTLFGKRHVQAIQMGRTCSYVFLDVLEEDKVVEVRPCPPGVDGDRARQYAVKQYGIDYSVATIFSIALSLLTPKAIRFDFRRHGDALICSALVARSWEHGGWDCPTDPYQITPAELAMVVEPA
jgi:hypothetical protein